MDMKVVAFLLMQLVAGLAIPIVFVRDGGLVQPKLFRTRSKERFCE